MTPPNMDARTPWFHAPASLKRRWLTYLSDQHPHHDPDYKLGLAALIGGAMLVAFGVIVLLSENPLFPYLVLPVALIVLFHGARAVRRHSNSRADADELRSVIRKGVPVTGYIVWAHEGLYKEGVDALPCRVLFSTDNMLESDVDYMRHLARNVFALSDKGHDDNEMRQVARLSTDTHYVRYRRQRLPLTLTDGSPVYCADLWVPRAYLPEGYLMTDMLPCLAEPGPVGGMELVPYWLLSAPTAIAPPRRRPQERRVG